MTANPLDPLFSKSEPPSLAIVVAHPDDEVVAVAGQLRRWRHAQVIYVTDGAGPDLMGFREGDFRSAQDYALARQRESVAALGLAGFRLEQIHQLEFPEQQASRHLLAIAGLLADKFFDLRPEFVVTHAYEGGHPDHDATAFAVHAACDIVRRQRGSAPQIVEAAAHFHRASVLETSAFLVRPDVDVMEVTLLPEEQAFKRRLLNSFKTQRDILKFLPVDVERFRPAPSYDFTKPPQEGRCYYELVGYEMTAERWCNLARETQTQLENELRLGAELVRKVES